MSSKIETFDSFVEYRPNKKQSDTIKSFLRVYEYIETNNLPFSGFFSEENIKNQTQYSLTKYINCGEPYLAFVEFNDNKVKSLLLVEKGRYQKTSLRFQTIEEQRGWAINFYTYVMQNKEIHLKDFEGFGKDKNENIFIVGELLDFKDYFYENKVFQKDTFNDFVNILCENKHISFNVKGNNKENKTINFFNKMEELPFFFQCDYVRVYYNTKNKKEVPMVLFEFVDL